MDEESNPPPTHEPIRVRRFAHLVKTQRALQVILGLFWILDGALQFQPSMFGKSFVTTFIVANAGGQPAVIGWMITNVGHFLEPHVAVWNSLFATVQVVIGVGLLFRRSVRPVLALSFAWVLGVWFFGEGMGMILTGTATALTGAPGSVLIYGLIGLMAWPRDADAGAEVSADGLATSAAGQGLGGVATPLVVWSGYWSLAAVLFLLPDNRTRTSVSSAIVGMAPGTPSWFDHFLTSIGHDFTRVGTQTSWVLAIVSLVIGLGPLLVRRSNLFLLAGGVVAAVMWITGQGWLGGIFSGTGTDPNTGPLVILLALAMVPAEAAERAGWRPPFAQWFRRSPVAAVGGALGLGLALLLSAAYPVAAQETTAAAMGGMVGMGSSGDTATTASCTAGNSGVLRTGLDVNNTPYMIMAGHNLGMDMNGADATAAAGLNTTKANWHYSGPTLPQAVANLLLADGANGPDDIHMASTGCSPEPTFSQQINATQYVQATSQYAGRFADPLAALAAGYQAVSPVGYPVVYYVNPTIEAANLAAKRTLNPEHVDGLVYVKIPSSQEVLAAAMYVLPSSLSSAPMPFGPLLQWHQRTSVCGSSTGSVAALAITGYPPCAAGTEQRATPYLTMVWQIPVAGGALAIQPPDIQIMEAAIMQSTGTGS